MLRRFPIFSTVPKGIWALGFSTLFKNLSAGIIVTFGPLFLTQVLHMNMMSLGVLEGVVESTSFLSRVFSGILSDSLRKRKALILVGYGVSFVGRIFLALSTNILEVFISRSCERLGNGIQASPRDALVGDLSSAHNRGVSFGLRHSLAVIGSLLGSILGMAVMYWTHNNYRTLFWITLIPSGLAIIVLALGVKEPSFPPKAVSSDYKGFQWSDIGRDIRLLTVPYWKLMILCFVFMCSNFAFSFLIFAAERTGLDVRFLPILMMTQSILTVVTAFPFGRLADLIDRRWVVAGGILCMACANIILGLADHWLWVLFASALWGTQMGVTQSNLLAFVSETTPIQVRGTGFGIYHFITGVSVLISNTIMGTLWHTYSPGIAFGVIACVTFLALVAVPYLTPRPSKLSKSLTA